MKNIKNQQWCFDTLCVHAGEGVDTDTKAIRRPIHMANCYAFPTDITELLETLSWEGCTGDHSAGTALYYLLDKRWL